MAILMSALIKTPPRRSPPHVCSQDTGAQWPCVPVFCRCHVPLIPSNCLPSPLRVLLPLEEGAGRTPCPLATPLLSVLMSQKEWPARAVHQSVHSRFGSTEGVVLQRKRPGQTNTLESAYHALLRGSAGLHPGDFD